MNEGKGLCPRMMYLQRSVLCGYWNLESNGAGSVYKVILWLLNLTKRLVISLFQVLHRWILALQSLINAYLSTPHSFLVTLIPSLRAILNHHRSPRSHFWRHDRRNQQCLGVHPRWPTKPSRPVVRPLWYGVSALMVNGTKTIPLNSLGGATGTAATEFRWDLVMGVFNKPLSSPSVSLNLSFGRVFYIMTTNYDRKWELDLMFTAIPFRPPRVFRFSLIDITRRWNNPAGHQSTIPAISYIAKSSSIFSFEFRGKAVYTSHLWDKDRNGFLAKDAKTEIPIEPNNTVSFIEPILSQLLRTYLVNVSLGYIPTRVSTALADVKKGCLVGRDALAQGEVDGMAFPGSFSGRWQTAGGLHRSWREPWFVMLRCDFAYDKCGRLEGDNGESANWRRGLVSLCPPAPLFLFRNPAFTAIR